MKDPPLTLGQHLSLQLPLLPSAPGMVAGCRPGSAALQPGHGSFSHQLRCSCSSPGRAPSSPMARACRLALRLSPRAGATAGPLTPRGVHGPLGGAHRRRCLAWCSPARPVPGSPPGLSPRPAGRPAAPGRKAQHGSCQGAPGLAGLSSRPPQGELGQRVRRSPGPSAASTRARLWTHGGGSGKGRCGNWTHARCFPPIF